MAPLNGIYIISNAKARNSFLTMDTSLALDPTYVIGHNWIDSDHQKVRD